jgi:hypothetical protein
MYICTNVLAGSSADPAGRETNELTRGECVGEGKWSEARGSEERGSKERECEGS